jgi:hypothetical protein
MISIRRLFLLASLALTASAGPIMWTVDVTTLGTSVDGSFIYDADTNTYSAVEFTTVGGSVIPSETWTTLIESFHSSTYIGLVDTTASNETGANMLGLFFTTALTDAGGTTTVWETQQGVCTDATCTNFNIYSDDPSHGWNTDVSGPVVDGAPTPEPASLVLVGMGGSLLLLLRKKRRRPSN